MMSDLQIPAIDLITGTIFVLCWFGYGFVAKLIAQRRPSMMATVRGFRQRWIERMAERDNHIADAALISNLLRGALFFASTTVFILGGLAALLGTVPTVAVVISNLPYTAPAEPRLAEIKALIIILLFIYAFFKFSWSAWQYNILSIVVGAMPALGTEAAVRASYVAAGGRIVALAGESYNNGVRAYYFSIPLMAWFLNPFLCIAAALAVTVVIYRREFYSPVLSALKHVAH